MELTWLRVEVNTIVAARLRLALSHGFCSRQLLIGNAARIGVAATKQREYD